MSPFTRVIAACLLLTTVQGFLDTEKLQDPTQYGFIKDYCASNGVEVDEAMVEGVKTCLKPVMDKLAEVDIHHKFRAICDNAEEIRGCYEGVFETLEKCVPAWSSNENVFRPHEIFDNLNKALCPLDLTERINNVVVLDKDGKAALMCGMRHYKAIGEDLISCPVAMQILLDPAGSLGGEKICGMLDNFENCLISTLDLCDKSELVIKYAKKLFDVFVGIAFKCPAHENF